MAKLKSDVHAPGRFRYSYKRIHQSNRIVCFELSIYQFLQSDRVFVQFGRVFSSVCLS